MELRAGPGATEVISWGVGLSHYWALSSLGFEAIQVTTVVTSRASKPAPMRCISLLPHLSSEVLSGWDVGTIPHLLFR